MISRPPPSLEAPAAASTSAGAATPRLTEARLREALRAHLGSRPSVRAAKGQGRAAAVLVPLTERNAETHVWLVRRPDTLRDHGGQVAFPGGKRDPSDDSLQATALREADEEIGLTRGAVDLLGMLDDYVTITGFTITPFVAWVPSDFAPRPSDAEVARVFAAPLATFLEAPTGPFPYTGYSIEGELVWGATAAMARGLGAIVRELGLAG